MNPDKYNEALVYEGRIRMPYNWSVGETGSRFFAGLQQEGRIWATRCEQCSKTYLPPRRSCPVCLAAQTTWVELPPVGTLLTYTITRYSVPAIQPAPVPYACGVIRLDGCDTGLVHLLQEVEFGQLKSGMRVEAVFQDKEKRQGNMMDIAYFRPAKNGGVK